MKGANWGDIKSTQSMRVALGMAMSVGNPGRHTLSRCGVAWGSSMSVVSLSTVSESSNFRILAAVSPRVGNGRDVCVNSVDKIPFWYWVLLTGGPPGSACGFSFSMALKSGFLGIRGESPCCVVDNSGCAGSLLFGLFLDARSWDPVALPLLSTVARWRSDFLGSFGSSPGLVGKSLSVGFVAGSVSGRAGGR